MSTKELERKENKIRTLIAKLGGIGDLRPGTLTVQHRKPDERKMPFHQISYTHKGKSRSEYVRPENLNTIRSEIAAYKKFRHIVEQIIDLSLETSRLRHKKR